MSNVTISPNMNLPVPVVGTDPGPDWATNVAASLNAVDSHNHSAGQGVPISPAGILINADLPFHGNNATALRSTGFSSQSAPLADLSCTYVSGGELYYNDLAGNQVKITTGGAVNAGAGSISGLPSGTASALYSGGTFFWSSATNTPANMKGASFLFSAQISNPKFVSVGASAAMPANYDLVWPVAAPAANQSLKSDSSGNLSWFLAVGQPAGYNVTLPAATPLNHQSLTSDASGNLSWGFTIPIGAAITYPLAMPAAAPAAHQTLVAANNAGNLAWSFGLLPIGSVTATFPNLAGAYSCVATTVADAYGFVLCQGQTIADATSPMNGAVIPDLSTGRFLLGAGSAGITGGNATVTLSTGNLPAHTHAAGSYVTSVGVTGGTASLTGSTVFASSSHTHNFAHHHQWGYYQSASFPLEVLLSGNSAQGSFSSGTDLFTAQYQGFGSGLAQGSSNFGPATGLYSSGALGAPSGSAGSATTAVNGTFDSIGISSTAASMTGSNTVTGTSGSTGSGTSFSILPPYLICIYVMRVK